MKAKPNEIKASVRTESKQSKKFRIWHRGHIYTCTIYPHITISSNTDLARLAFTLAEAVLKTQLWSGTVFSTNLVKTAEERL